MKNLKFLKLALLLFVAVSFVRCDEDDPIETIISAEVSTTLDIKNIGDKSSYSVAENVQIKDALKQFGSIKSAKITGVKMTLKNFDAGTVSGKVTFTAAGLTQVNNLTLTNDTSVEFSLSQFSGGLEILKLGGSTIIPISVTLETADGNPVGDNDFQLVVEKQIRARGNL